MPSEHIQTESQYSISFLKYFIYLFLERGREGEKHQCVVASCTPPPGHLARNPGTCPDWELNWRPFGSQSSAQFTEPKQPGPQCLIYIIGLLIHTPKHHSLYLIGSSSCVVPEDPWPGTQFLLESNEISKANFDMRPFLSSTFPGPPKHVGFIHSKVGSPAFLLSNEYLNPSRKYPLLS